MTERLPNSQDCFVCGVGNAHGLRLKFLREDGRVFTRVTLPDWAVGFRGVAHGGLVATLLDEVMGWSANCAAKCATMTAEMTVRYRRPTPVGEELLHQRIAELTETVERLQGAVERQNGSTVVNIEDDGTEHIEIAFDR